ncbi:alpha/beta fold hydrolase [Arthrobacter rhombi]|uniref:alpha/beta fold hydrolase n=1 Tax=Arthrobacter rhombi TaxID=71253 RepID=UPI003FD29357
MRGAAAPDAVQPAPSDGAITNPKPWIHRRGTGTPLVIIHGNGVDHRLLLPLDPCLATPGDWERIYLDLPGFGKTAALEEPGGLPELLHWLRGTISDLVGHEEFALLGNSLGGLLAGRIASTFGGQVLGLALLAPVVHPRPRDRTVPLRSILHRDPEFLQSLDPSDAHEFEQMTVYQSAESWAAFRDTALPGIRTADTAAGIRLARGYRLDDEVGPDTPPLTCPTLILTGRQDHIVGFEDQIGLLQRYPHATYTALDGAGHNVHLDQPGPVDILLKDWIRRIRQAAF